MDYKQLFIFIFLISSLNAGVESYFKKAGNKSAGHNMRNIDFIYMINLDPRPERYMRTRDALQPYDIHPYRFSAVNGWELSYQALDELGIIFQPGMTPGPVATVFRHDSDGQEYKSNEVMKEVGVAYYCHSLSRGSIGCLLSHLSILQDAYDSGYQTIWIVEDDIRVVSDPHQLSSMIDMLNHLAPDWDLFFTDNEVKGPDGNPIPSYDIRPRPNFQVRPLSYYRKRIPLTPDIVHLGMRFGSASMIVKRSGMKKLLDFFKTYKIYFPYDIDYFLVPDIQIYACTKDIVTNIAVSESDNAMPTYKDKR